MGRIGFRGRVGLSLGVGFWGRVEFRGRVGLGQGVGLG